MRYRLARFKEDFGERKVAEVLKHEIDDWLRNLEGAPQSRNNYRSTASW